MTTFAYTPSYGTDVSEKPTILESKFGGGYAQRSAEGINNIQQIWSVKFTVTPAVANTIMGLLRGWGGVTPFTWTTPEGLVKNFVCKDYKRSFDTFGQHTVSGTFEQDFAP